ncbi:unnamed protein product [Ixodes persulcatus]
MHTDREVVAKWRNFKRARHRGWRSATMAVIDRALSLGGHASGVRIQPGAQKTGRK